MTSKKTCIICGLPCKPNAKYCLPCGKQIRRNWSIAYVIKRKLGIKTCPICFTPIIKEQVICNNCKKLLEAEKNLPIRKI